MFWLQKLTSHYIMEILYICYYFVWVICQDMSARSASQSISAMICPTPTNYDHFEIKQQEIYLFDK